jgi:hypothetical protein
VLYGKERLHHAKFAFPDNVKCFCRNWLVHWFLRFYWRTFDIKSFMPLSSNDEHISIRFLFPHHLGKLVIHIWRVEDMWLTVLMEEIRIGQKFFIYRMFQKELYSGIQNVTVWRVLRKRLHLKACNLSIVHHLGYHCKALFETPCITSESHIEPWLFQIKLGVSCYIMMFQNTVHILWINLYKISKL